MGAGTGTAGAQTDGSIAVGATYSIKETTADGTRGSATIGPLWRFGHGHDGWGWGYGLNWYTADLEHVIGGQRIDLGELHIRPFMGGYGYSRRIGPVRVKGELLGGYAFTSFSVAPPAEIAYQKLLGAASLDVDGGNTWVVKPTVSAWFDLTRKIGVNVSAGYMVARPTLTIASSVGTERQHLHADAFMFKVGAVYSIF